MFSDCVRSPKAILLATRTRDHILWSHSDRWPLWACDHILTAHVRVANRIALGDLTQSEVRRRKMEPHQEDGWWSHSDRSWACDHAFTSLLYEMCRTVQYEGSSVVNDSTTLYDPIRPRPVVLSNTIRLYCHCSSEYPAWCLLTPSVEYGYTIMSRMACQDLVGWLPACICHRCFFFK